MAISLVELTHYLDELLEPGRFSDYAPNGLQVEGRAQVSRVATAVSANAEAISAAVEVGADALIVHHGFFWRGEERTIVGHRAQRLGALLGHGLSLLAYHLPLDAHPRIGNNAGLLAAIGASLKTPLGGDPPVGWLGPLSEPAPVAEILQRITQATARTPLAFLHGPSPVRTVAAVTGGGAGYFEEAVAAGADLFVTGEPSEMAQGLAVEMGASFVAAGHHATERFGPRALGLDLEERFGLAVTFIDVDNPV
jgi:dinuclear metal center YbgI/SA1388 family protein